MRIAVDAMGGDKAPEVLVQGAVEALKGNSGDLEVILVGERKVLEDELSKFPHKYDISIAQASEVVGMDESPTQALRKKKGSSIAVAISLQKDGLADAVISAGNTGAAMAYSLHVLGRLTEVNRPAIAQPFPAEREPCVVLDVGANSECKPLNLFQFAVMGSLYVDHTFGVQRPKVGLLSIGEESSKGNELVVEAHRLLSESSLNFIGNVEGSDILRGTADVVVCDGFVGNVILKFTESVIGMLSVRVRERAMDSLTWKLGAFLLRPVFEEIRREMDYQEYGGAPLLGVDGVVVICHGSSSAKAISNAIKVAQRMVQGRVNDHIKEHLQRDGQVNRNRE